MAQTTLLINTLKTALKARGKTYLDVAEALSLSEASIKRMFAARHITLKRLDKICEMLDMEVSELVSLMQEQRHLISELTEVQEQQLVSDQKLLLVAVCCLNHFSFDDILENYDYTERDLIQYLKKLEKLNLLDFLASGRIKLLVNHNFKWLPNGPIQQLFNQKVRDEFFQSGFDQPGEQLSVITGSLSASSNAIIKKQIDRLIGEFNSLSAEDQKLPLAKRFGTTMVVAMRPWELSYFEQHRRTGIKRQFE